MKKTQCGFGDDETEKLDKAGAMWSLVMTIAIVATVWVVQFLFHPQGPPVR